ncbi:putative epoxide hydrolase [Corallococcus macrosporus]|uniref:Putative epoxide hydrolase n=1 Tax=Myxococcus fulvus (strain ATCC BAA-855 / HW-1) TaxID=483219 RepID=F8C8I1_MYXFH|nr:putative epoxide hydrolase [Corallococcus macrosporus]
MAGITHRTVTANGINLHLAEAGTGPLVLLVHGWPESWYSWRHQLPALAAAGAAAIAPDVRGHGVEAGRRQRRKLVAPRVPGLRPAMHEQHERPRARLREVQVDAIRRDGSMRDACHGTLRGEGGGARQRQARGLTRCFAARA